jgi:transcriptional regulator EpsA
LQPAAADVPSLMEGAVPVAPNPAQHQNPAQHHFLGAADIDRLLLVIDSSLKVRLRHHFFRWTQGAVQSLLPHDGLICVIGDARSSQPQVDFFTSMVVAEKDREFMQRQHGGLYADLLRHWRQHDRQPLAYSRGGLLSEFDLATRARLSTLPFGRITAHGIGGPNGEMSCFFGLLGACGEAAPHHSYLMELLLPYFHAAWLRVLAEQPLEAPQADLPIDMSVLTGRQIEIMRWVHEGKSNIEIGLILGISALTVKNHVQKILRKLNVQNRTQAVAKCMSHRIFKPSLRS